MANNKPKKRLSKIAKEFNVGISTIVDFLQKNGIEIEANPNTKVTPDCYDLLVKEYSTDIHYKQESEKLSRRKSREKKETVSLDDIDKDKKDTQDEDVVMIKEAQVPAQKDTPVDETVQEETSKQETEKEEEEKQKEDIKILGKLDLDDVNKKSKKTDQKKKPEEKKDKIEPTEKTKEEKTTEKDADEKKKEEVEKKVEKEELHIEQKQEQKQEEKQEKEPLEEAEATEKKDEKDDTQKKKQEDSHEKPEKKIEKKETKVEEPKEKEQTKEKDTKTEDEQSKDPDVKVIGKINLENINQKTRPDKKVKEQKKSKQVDDKKQTHKEKQESKTEVKDKKKKDEQRRKKSTKVDEKKMKEKSGSDNTNVRKKESDKEKKESKHSNQKQEEDEVFKSKVKKLSGPTVVGKIDLSEHSKNKKRKKKKPVASSSDKTKNKKKKRRRIQQKINVKKSNNKKQEQKQDDKQRQRKHRRVTKKSQRKPKGHKNVVDEEDVQKQIKETLARLTAGKQKSKAAKYRRTKREQISKKQQEEQEKKEKEQKVLKVTEFITANELASMMDVHVNEIISMCMTLGQPVNINQRLDAETISLIAEEFGYEVEFTTIDVKEMIDEEEIIEDSEEELEHRAPIVTVMGHVDHGKTSLLDYIRNANVVAGEAGGITQHIGAYNVTLDNDKKITFLDTPGHEAFTAMRARGAQVTDIAIIVVAADDSVMPQTVEAINHAQAANIPIVFAINKIDKPGANPDKIKEQLANMNYLVEDWGGKYQSEDISAKKGLQVDELLEKVLLEAEMLELKANPNKRAVGTIIESSLDKGRGYIATVLISAGTLQVGDIMLAGCYTGRVRAMYNERNKRVEKVEPSEPVIVLGLNGAPQAGDSFYVMEHEREAREIANKKEQLQREQTIRAQKHITLDEIGRRIAIGNFQELNIIIKGDVDGSIEALADAFYKLSTEEIQVNVIHKAVGQISESDIMLAAASNAIVVGFQVRPSMGARKLAENEGIDIRLYSVIYDAVNEIKDAMAGMLSPELKEQVIGTAEIRETFKISKVGTVAGCFVKDGKITRDSKVRVIRDGIVVYTGELGSLKRFKDDVKEVKSGFECGLNIEKFNDIKVEDIIEAFKEVEVERKL